MSNGSGQGHAGSHAPVSEPSAAPPHEGTTPHRGPVHLKSPRSLERLRNRVKKAAQELERLRKENAVLAERIQQLETRPAIDLEGTVLSFDEDPEDLRKKVERFIQAIDAYLATENG